MAKTQPPRAMKMFNGLTKILLRLGFAAGGQALLTVRGRKSGKLITTPVVVSILNGQRWLVAFYGPVNWVRNLRVAGEATLTQGRRTERVSAFEPSPQEAAPLLKHTLQKAPSFSLAYFDVTPDAPLEDFEREVPKHPVFILRELS